MAAKAAGFHVLPGRPIDLTMTKDEIEHELERLHPESFGWALTCCDRKLIEAEDVLQTAYVKVLDGTARFEGRSSFRTWLFGVIRLTAAHKRRKFNVRERLLKLLFVQQSKTVAAGPVETLAYSLQSRNLIRALNELSVRQSQILQLVFYHDMTIEMAAEVLGISLGTARTHYARGKKSLANRFKEREND